MTRVLFALIALILLPLAGCAAKLDLTQAPVPLGNFLLGHNIVVAESAQLGPLSREATAEEWQTSLKDAIEARIGRYDGTDYYHLGINIDAYALALPGIPVVAKPKSVLVASVTVWDDAKGVKINEKPKQLYVFESFSGETFISSGLTQNKARQMRNLSFNMAARIEDWLRENEAWFGGPGARVIPVPVPGSVDPGAAAQAVPQPGPVVDPVTVTPLN